MVEHCHIGIGVVEVVGVWRVVFFSPVGRQRTFQIKNMMLRFGLIVNTVKAHHLRCINTHYNRLLVPLTINCCSLNLFKGDVYMLQEEMQLRVTAGVNGRFKKRHEDILQHLLKVSQLLLCSVHITEDE